MLLVNKCTPGVHKRVTEENMRKLNKTAACGILAAALAAGTLSGCSKAIDGTKTVATVGDEKVTLGLASYMVRDQQAQTTSYYNMLMSQYGVSGSASNVWDQKGDDGKTVGESSKDGVMTTINQLYVLKAHAADYDVTITEDEEKAIKEAAAEFIKDNDEKILKKLAVSEDDIVTYLELVTIRSKMHESRLLERSSRLSDEEGGGSITALPIIETQAGDLSAYIPTNVISITDGQIFLESDLFFSGMRPAVNVGLSVSRVGGAAQTKAMKKAAGSIRIDLAQYREMEVFTQFSSDLDETTKAQLQYGKCLMELLKQPLCNPLSMPQQVITLVAATHKVLVDVEVSKLKAFQMDMLQYFADMHKEIIDELNDKKVLSDELTEKIVEVAEEFKKSRC